MIVWSDQRICDANASALQRHHRTAIVADRTAIVTDRTAIVTDQPTTLL
jgi:type II secretory pathway component HofQ